MKAERTRNPRGEGIRLREEILTAAAGLLDETNDPGTLTLRGVARRAAISAPSIYAHFGDLAALTEALLASSFEQLRDTIARAVASQPPGEPERALLAAGTAYVQYGWDHPARYQLMFTADGYAANAIETFTLVESLITACARSTTDGSADSRLDTWMLWAGLHGVATLEKPGRAEYRRLGPLDRQAMLQTMIRRLAQLGAADGS